MKALHLCAITFLFYFVSNAQEIKRNDNWIIGSSPSIKLSFNNPLTINLIQPNILTMSNSCISDTNGNLLFFSTGYYLISDDGSYMENGEHVNSPMGNILDNYYGGVSLFDQTSIILPKKGNTYYVFSTGMSDSFANNYLNQVNGAYWDVLNYSVVDMDSNNGKGKVVQKNVVLADDRRYANTAMHAVKHANGKDWWLVKADCYNNRYEEYIVREDTILGPFYQQATDSTHNEFCIGGMNQIYFNHSGTQMASSIYGTIYNGGTSNTDFKFNRVEIYDFNRCDGKLTYKKFYETPYDTSSYPNNDYKSGICFSPNDSLLYMSNTYTIYQIDLTDTSTYNATFITGPDTTINQFPWYWTMATAPDGKLYVGNYGGMRKSMSYIDKPNVKGVGCDFKAQGLWQPYTNILAPPNMPNYGLSADSALLVGCEPVSIREFENLVMLEWHVYPNPSSTNFYIKSRKGKKKEMFNSVGQMVLSTNEDEIDVSKLAKGIYYLRCNNEVKKVVIE
jgi:hypothetical protein